MQHLRSLLAVVMLSPTLVAQAAAQRVGTCESPMDAPEPGIALTLDTRSFQNNETGGACTDSLATGPEAVLSFSGTPAVGGVTWSADFDAVVYYRKGGCDFAECSGASSDGYLAYDSDPHWRDWDTPYIVVDGLNGSSGTITLTFDYGAAMPTIGRSWGRVKSTYR